MRLSQPERELIRQSVSRIDPDAEIRLFGSRLKDSAKGGDIDLLCISRRIDRHARRRLTREISDRLGGQRIDLIVADDAEAPFPKLILPDSVAI
ncbi:MAG: nucleotidyltransferase domain-containing protein [Opitutales bacterium]